MPGRDPDASEWRAATAVASIIGGEAVPHDVEGAPDGSHDFDIVLSDGRTIAVEITTPEDGAALAMTKAALLPTHAAPGLARNWRLGVDADSQPRVSRIAKQAPRFLAVLEAHDVTQVDAQQPFGATTHAKAVIDAARSMVGLGVIRATALGEVDDAEVFFSLRSGTAAAREEINVIVEEHAGYNIDKLRAATGVAERHLFIVIPMSQSSAELAMATLPPPALAPTLPKDLDVVWVANWHARIIWRLPAGGAWNVLRAPADR